MSWQLMEWCEFRLCASASLGCAPLTSFFFGSAVDLADPVTRRQDWNLDSLQRDGERIGDSSWMVGMAKNKQNILAGLRGHSLELQSALWMNQQQCIVEIEKVHFKTSIQIIMNLKFVAFEAYVCTVDSSTNARSLSCNATEHFNILKVCRYSINRLTRLCSQMNDFYLLVC